MFIFQLKIVAMERHGIIVVLKKFTFFKFSNGKGYKDFPTLKLFERVLRFLYKKQKKKTKRHTLKVASATEYITKLFNNLLRDPSKSIPCPTVR